MKAAAAAGRDAWAGGDLGAAESRFLEAWSSIPDPKLEYDFAQSLARGLVIFYRDTGQFEKAHRWLKIVGLAYGGEENPSVQFLIGTVALDAGDEALAFSAFEGLHRRWGARPFQGADPKYLRFFRQRQQAGTSGDEGCE